MVGAREKYQSPERRHHTGGWKGDPRNGSIGNDFKDYCSKSLFKYLFTHSSI